MVLATFLENKTIFFVRIVVYKPRVVWGFQTIMSGPIYNDRTQGDRTFVLSDNHSYVELSKEQCLKLELKVNLYHQEKKKDFSETENNNWERLGNILYEWHTGTNRMGLGTDRIHTIGSTQLEWVKQNKNK